ncbi:hypothetical protein AOQ84DRAFT_414799, partial [Glonium stellatum]
ACGGKEGGGGGFERWGNSFFLFIIYFYFYFLLFYFFIFFALRVTFDRCCYFCCCCYFIAVESALGLGDRDPGKAGLGGVIFLLIIIMLFFIPLTLVFWLTSRSVGVVGAVHGPEESVSKARMSIARLFGFDPEKANVRERWSWHTQMELAGPFPPVINVSSWIGSAVGGGLKRNIYLRRGGFTMPREA